MDSKDSDILSESDKEFFVNLIREYDRVCDGWKDIAAEKDEMLNNSVACVNRHSLVIKLQKVVIENQTKLLKIMFMILSEISDSLKKDRFKIKKNILNIDTDSLRHILYLCANSIDNNKSIFGAAADFVSDEIKREQDFKKVDDSVSEDNDQKNNNTGI